ncbi:unnamed protein product [Enterobius vermicularis]|uniref:Transposase n=1 Tax=Enterobius vermicularis TaxID=51028 RepID=A0A0N4VQL2_ENTVE|nr:unnamed protein product [Enterobius vermicularis]
MVVVDDGDEDDAVAVAFAAQAVWPSCLVDRPAGRQDGLRLNSAKPTDWSAGDVVRLIHSAKETERAFN